MLCPRPTPLNRRPNVPNLPRPHRAHPPAERVRSSAESSRSADEARASILTERFAMAREISRMGPKPWIIREMNTVHLPLEEAPQFSGDLVVRNQQSIVVRQRNQMSVEQPMHGARKRQPILDDVRSA